MVSKILLVAALLAYRAGLATAQCGVFTSVSPATAPDSIVSPQDCFDYCVALTNCVFFTTVAGDCTVGVVDAVSATLGSNIEGYVMCPFRATPGIKQITDLKNSRSIFLFE
ncbi:uncharacterized protein LOC131929505 [Physella acuta]|uniref:uncharacterized protein LOC131929505 n=1 Tax=Physella acuta TaxID=109671 RepID=UPI0027DC8B31|nr:uncharacterized protein LOC131929505 [Physella acuta]